jgi:multisubunit Na+/H+ antiporter MnhC subunit
MQSHDTSQVFQANDVQALGTLASNARWWGTMSLVIGSIAIVIAVPVMTIFGDGTRAEVLAVAAFALVGVLVGTSYMKAGRALHGIRTEPHRGPELTVRGMDALGRAFRLEAIVLGMSMTIAFVVGLLFITLQRS